MMTDSKSFIFSVFKLTGLLSYFIHAGLTYEVDRNNHSHIKLKIICKQKYMSKHYLKRLLKFTCEQAHISQNKLFNILIDR